MINKYWEVLHFLYSSYFFFLFASAGFILEYKIMTQKLHQMYLIGDQISFGMKFSVLV